MITMVSALVAPRDFDVVVVGAGIGGLCSGALLSKYGLRVCVLESHDVVGGCAHGFERGGYKLDAGPSLWAGCSVPSTNPLRQVLDAVGAETRWVSYDGWGCHDVATGDRWRMTVGSSSFDEVVRRFGGDDEVAAWRRLLEAIDPVVDAAMACPPMALRADAIGFAATAFFPYLLGAVSSASLRTKRFAPDLLTGPASALLDLAAAPRDGFVQRWIDYLAFAISGLPSDRTVGAALAYSLGDLYHDGAFLDYPLGGSEAVVEALAANVASRDGCEVRTNAHVEKILLDGRRATGVRLRDGTELVARRAVISNCDMWSTAGLVGDTTWSREIDAKQETPSFVHLWVGFDATGLPADLDCHHSVFGSGFFDSTPIDARAHMHIISIPSLFDPSLAPPGKHVAHVYAAANEPYDEWARPMTRDEYRSKKEEAAEPLWVALEQVVPDVRSRADLVLVGTPRTHERFNRRHRGTYGPSFGEFADGTTPIDDLWLVGDSNFPGIGVPAAAASAILVANALVPLNQHTALLDDMRAANTLRAGKGWWADASLARPQSAPGGRISLRSP